jgi:hypothetical protein
MGLPSLTGTTSTVPLNRAASMQLQREMQYQLFQTSGTIKAVVESTDLDPAVAFKAAALMEEIDTFLLEGTQGNSQGDEPLEDLNCSQGNGPRGAAGPQVAIGMGSLPMSPMANENDSDGNSCWSADLQSPPQNMGTANSENGGISEVDL